MPLTEEFTAEIDSVTTAHADAVKEENKGEEPDGGGAFVPEGETNNGDNTGDNKPGSEPDPGTGEGGKADPQGEGGDSEGAGDGDGAGDGGHEGVTPAAVMRAIQVGISAADAVALGDDKLVDQLINERVQDEADAIAAEEEAAQRAADEKAAEDKLKTLQESLPTLDPEETDPNVIEAFEAMKKLITDQQSQLDQFRTEQASQSSAADAVREREVATWFEGKVTELSEGFDKVLGENGVGAVNITPEIGDAIAGKVAVTVEVHRANGWPIPSLDDMFEEAARSVMKDDFARLDEAHLLEKMEKRSGQEISRPGGSKSKTERSPDEEVADMLNKRYFADRS
jgi:hypothetical protein